MGWDSKNHINFILKGIWWILGIRYAATATARREIFGNALRGKLHQLGSPNLQDIFIGR